MNILHSIGAGVATVGLFIASLFGYTPAQAPETLGVALPTGIADFETALATGITNTATTMTLTSVAIRGGGTLSGYECFVIDEGSAQEEYVCGTASSTSVTGLERGLSPADGVTEDTDLKFSHRRGASVKIVDFPLIQRIQAQNNGDATFENVLQYASTVATSTVAANSQNIANVAYVNSLSFGGVAASASTSVSGFVELATGVEAASTTIGGSTGAMLALHTGISTSTAPSSGNVIPVTGSDGNIDSGFLAQDINPKVSLTASSTFTGATSPQASYITTSGTASTSSAVATTSNKFDGFVVTTTSIGSSATLQTAGVVSGFSGLTAGSAYYLSDTAGAISTTGGTSKVLVGIAISTTQLLIQKDKPTCSGNGGSLGTASGSLVVTCGFVPKKIVINAHAGDSGFQSVMNASFTNGITTAVASVYNEATGGTVSQSAVVYDQEAGADYMTFTVGSFTATSFTITWTETGTFGSSAFFYFEAE